MGGRRRVGLRDVCGTRASECRCYPPDTEASRDVRGAALTEQEPWRRAKRRRASAS